VRADGNQRNESARSLPKVFIEAVSNATKERPDGSHLADPKLINSILKPPGGVSAMRLHRFVLLTLSLSLLAFGQPAGAPKLGADAPTMGYK
jgi:hypothetical protein